MTTDVRMLKKTALEPMPVVEPGTTVADANEQITSIVLGRRTPRWWVLGLLVALGLAFVFLLSVAVLFAKGTGIWGLQVPIAWAFDITNFVWWIGIGHAGTLISAILLLLRQEWRTSINRLAEAMTVFAVIQATMFPLLHLGRPWYLYWLLPYPNTMSLPPQFRSPLVWDAFAVTTYASISMVFWYIGMIPDLASLRDRATNIWVKRIYSILSFGWRGSARHWKRFNQAFYLVAALVTALVVSVHTIVSFDFAVGIVPGWHNTIYPPYFVAGAVYSGFAMVLVLMIPLRRLFKVQNLITEHHLDNSAKVMLTSGLIVTYGYIMENFHGMYTGNVFDIQAIIARFVGPFAIVYWLQLIANVVFPQLLWFRRFRANKIVLFLVSLGILFGMWMERFVLITTNLARTYLPSKWGVYIPTVWDFSTFVGTLGLFLTLLFLFLRFLPMIANFEMRELITKKSLLRGHGPVEHQEAERIVGGPPVGGKAGEEIAG